jgi:hypothetical protein
MSKGIASFTDEPFLLNMINKKQLTKHFAGQHDQSTHGSWAHGDVNDFTLDSRFQDAINNLETWEVQTDGFKETEVGKYLLEYSKTSTSSEKQFEAMKKRLMSEINLANNSLSPKLREAYKDITPAIQDVLDNGRISIAMDSESFGRMIAAKDPRFKTQFETAESNGLYDPSERRMAEATHQGIPYTTKNSERPIYGYIAVDGSEESITTPSVGRYGNIRFVLKDVVKDRTTFTMGDSLNLGAMPVQVNKKITLDEGIRASNTPLLMRHASDGWQGTKSFDKTDYFEAQIYGGITLKGVEKIYIPKSAVEIIEISDFRRRFPDIQIIEYTPKEPVW